jgi:NAD(P)-dependent dehydrogenase (short-subunit alcohol dehydrogenase family)
LSDAPSLLAGRAFVVTGTSRGIGRAIASGISAVEGDVVAVSRRGEAPPPIAGRIEALTLDVTAADAPALAYDASLRLFGRVDGLVNNAGVIHFGPCHTFGDAEWDELVETNLTAPFRFAQEFVRRWLEDRVAAVIVNLGSVESEVAIEQQVGYAATKGGILGLTRAMAIELAPHGVRVNAVGPGVIDTGMTGPVKAETETRIPLGRLGTTEEVADAVVFLLSDQSSYVTGAILFADGGYTAR